MNKWTPSHDQARWYTRTVKPFSFNRNETIDTKSQYTHPDMIVSKTQRDDERYVWECCTSTFTRTTRHVYDARKLKER